MTIFFPDVSHYNGLLNIDTMPALFAKCSQGATLGDSTLNNKNFSWYHSEADRLGIPIAGYHYLMASDAGLQAQNAFNRLGTTIPAMVDVEKGAGTLANTLSFIDAYRQRKGIIHLVYLPHWYWVQIGSPSLQPLIDRQMVLISSSYPSKGYSDDGVGWDSYGGMKPLIWQYTDARPFDNTKVDFNAFAGTSEQLAALMMGGTMSAPQQHLTDADAAVVTGHKIPGSNESLGGTVWDADRYARAAYEQAMTANAKLDALAKKVDAVSAKLGVVATPAPPAKVG